MNEHMTTHAVKGKTGRTLLCGDRTRVCCLLVIDAEHNHQADCPKCLAILERQAKRAQAVSS